MERRTCATVAALFLLCAAANQGRGDVNLVSAELSTGRGFLIIPRNGDPSSSQATTFAAPVPTRSDRHTR